MTISERPGWNNVIGLAAYMASARSDPKKRREVRSRIEEGRLILDADNPQQKLLGIFAGAEAVAAETCQACGGKGHPAADTSGRGHGTWCDRCRPDGLARLARSWTPGAVTDTPEAVSPGQWTADIRGGATGNHWDAGNWRHYHRLETAYGDQIAMLMGAEEDEQAMELWTRSTGWAGLMRALFITLREEQDERPDDPGHVPWRLRWMKDKFGMLDVRTTGSTEYQHGAVWFIETMSAHVCMRCGQPGELRNASWIRVECDACWTAASARDRATDAAAKARTASDGDYGFRGIGVSW